ncbi:Heterogeneous nuclear ribonucleoprotein L, partial [Operophtera brumata]
MDFGSGGPPPGMMKDRHGPPPPHHPGGPPQQGAVMMVYGLDPQTANADRLFNLFSKQAYLSEVMNPYPLPDKSPSFKDYVGNKNNRFLTPASIHKNRIQPPSKVRSDDPVPAAGQESLVQGQQEQPLPHAGLLPQEQDTAAVQGKNRIQPPSKVFKDYDVTPPHTISKFPLKSERSSSGLMEFTNISQS